MVTRDDPSLSLIDQGLDLAGTHTNEYNLGQNGYTFGVTAYSIIGTTRIGVNIEELFDLHMSELSFSETLEQSTLPVASTSCDFVNTQGFEYSRCFQDATLQGSNGGHSKSKTLSFRLIKNSCLRSRAACSDSQNNTIEWL